MRRNRDAEATVGIHQRFENRRAANLCCALHFFVVVIYGQEQPPQCQELRPTRKMANEFEEEACFFTFEAFWATLQSGSIFMLILPRPALKCRMTYDVLTCDVSIVAFICPYVFVGVQDACRSALDMELTCAFNRTFSQQENVD